MALSSVATNRSSVTTRLASGRWSWRTMRVPATGPPCRTFPSSRGGLAHLPPHLPEAHARLAVDDQAQRPSSPWTAITRPSSRSSDRGDPGSDQQMALESIHVASVLDGMGNSTGFRGSRVATASGRPHDDRSRVPSPSDHAARVLSRLARRIGRRGRDRMLAGQPAGSGRPRPSGQLLPRPPADDPGGGVRRWRGCRFFRSRRLRPALTSPRTPI